MKHLLVDGKYNHKLLMLLIRTRCMPHALVNGVLDETRANTN